MLKLAQFCNCQRALRKIKVLKIKTKVFEVGEFLNVFLKILEFLRLIFLYIKSFIKKTSSSKARYCWGIELDLQMIVVITSVCLYLGISIWVLFR